MAQNIAILRQRGAKVFTCCTVFTTSIEKNANEGVVFTQEDGFQMAFAIIDSGSDDGEDINGLRIDDYIKVTVEALDISDSGKNYTRIVLETHTCSDEELGIV